MKNTIDEEKSNKLFKRLYNGDKNAINDLALLHQNLAKKCAHRSFSYLEYDEKYELCLYSLLNAIRTFKLDKDVSFSTYAVKCMENEIFMYLRKNKNNFQNISLDASFIEDDEQSSNLYNIFSNEEDIEDIYLRKEEYDNLYCVLNELEDRDREILFAAYGIGCKRLTKVKIAQKYNLSQGYIYKKIKMIENKIKEIYKYKKQEEIRINNKDIKKEIVYLFIDIFGNYILSNNKNFWNKLTDFYDNLTTKEKKIIHSYYMNEEKDLQFEIIKIINKLKIEYYKTKGKILIETINNSSNKNRTIDLEIMKELNNIDKTIKELSIKAHTGDTKAYDYLIIIYNRIFKNIVNEEDINNLDLYDNLYNNLLSIDCSFLTILKLYCGIGFNKQNKDEISEITNYSKNEINQKLRIVYLYLKKIYKEYKSSMEIKSVSYRKKSNIKNKDIMEKYKKLNAVDLLISKEKNEDKVISIYKYIFCRFLKISNIELSLSFYERLYEPLKQLSDEYYIIFKLYYGIGCKEHDKVQISKVMNLKKSTVAYKLNKIFVELSKKYKKIENEYNGKIEFNNNDHNTNQRKLFFRFHNGDDGAKNEIAEKYFKNIYLFIDNHYLEIDYEIKEQLCFLGFTKALNKFDFKKNETFLRFLLYHMNNEIIKYINKNRIKDESLEDIFSNSSDNYMLSLLNNSDNLNIEDSYIKKEDLYLIKEIIKTLNEQEIYILRLYYSCGYTFTEIAKLIGCTRRTINYRFKILYDKIRKEYDNLEYYHKVDISDNEQINYKELFITLYNKDNFLTDTDKYIMCLYYGIGYKKHNESHIAELLGVSKRIIDQKIKTILSKLEKEYLIIEQKKKIYNIPKKRMN